MNAKKRIIISIGTIIVGLILITCIVLLNNNTDANTETEIETEDFSEQFKGTLSSSDSDEYHVYETYDTTDYLNFLEMLYESNDKYEIINITLQYTNSSAPTKYIITYRNYHIIF